MNIGSKVIIFLLVIVAGIFAYEWWRSEKDKSDAGKIMKPDSAKFWKDAAGLYHATLQEQTASSGAAKIAWKKQLDSLAKLYHTSASNITRTTQEGTITKIDKKPGKIDTEYYPAQKNLPDSIKRIRSLTGSFHDNWIDLQTRLGDSSYFKVLVRDTDRTTFYKKGFFNKKNYMDITHSKSPYVSTTFIKSQYIEDANGGWSVSIIAGVGYDPTNLKLKNPIPFIGIGVSKRIFSLGK